ncbi:Bacterial sugar transferase [Acididesulfobacillus acetoxydans]|uniref:Bacterial sugar transferase n=1 Tax=Acididesulfobacillus acetoxydans TaxID=1561005 RepID=A0A8S0XD59_9FIRM|nr:sugar transferase [Acididesulfobacillus acetoxydans]CAA7603156.1 Bacterial sugar transferase [Acididesulfobacillus acetoxydans]CEJ07616.1 Glycosyl transferase possibly involved in lipopolysaccharide synthesis [Acididesulfobacillus acetoxydans]
MVSYLWIKRVLDVIFAFVLLIVTSLIMLGAAIVIKLESKGPVLFKQERPGRMGVIFTICKFRTMRVETEKDGEPLSDMERMTRIGKILRKLSVDELPQLFNILKGEMSFIGPRPLLVQYLPLYTPEQMRRHEVTPGISGWAQVNGRNGVDWETRFEYDLWYVEHVSLRVDLMIFLRTLAIVVMRRGVNQAEGVTMEEFTVAEERTFRV